MCRQNFKSHRQARGLVNLPPYYYHTNFCDFLKFVEDRYLHVFQETHFSFLHKFQNLSLSAQYLYVRIAGRKGSVFDKTKLHYPEITDIKGALSELRQVEFISSPSQRDFENCLSCLTKPKLVNWMSTFLSDRAFKASWQKQRLIDFALYEGRFSHIQLPNYLFVQGYQNELDYISFLYFGRIEPNLQKFTLRDLGVIKTPDFKADYSARFESLEEASTAYFYAKALFDFKCAPDSEIVKQIDTILDWPRPLCAYSTHVRDKLLQKLGGLSEQCQDIDTAIWLYSLGGAPQCNERCIRLRYKRRSTELLDRQWVKTRLEDMIDNPGSDSEYVFASDFYKRKYKKKRTSFVTDILRDSSCLSLDEAFKHEPEHAVKRYFQGQGIDCCKTENALWKMLFGLMFWDELFGPDQAGLHNSFEKLPSVLKSGQFYGLFKDSIEAKLEALKTPETLQITLLKTLSARHGIPNGIFRWKGRIFDDVRVLLKFAPAEAIANILRHMAKDFKNMKDGFPDLMLLDEGVISFTEVKAQGDIIRRNQLVRIMQLRQAGFKADILRVDWILDPHQIYVVVDVETTGSKAKTHRVTEIGAVKIQGGKIIDEWQSLLNPERSIPPFITQLTGITQAMVKEAPLFADRAESFKTFMGDAIFVAHNVNFDYGFIKSEYMRLNQRFRYPKLCTVSSMRKYYPGCKSYSLKNLCTEFDIDLTTHHRALCDAKAAAELLLLVNDKRGQY